MYYYISMSQMVQIKWFLTDESLPVWDTELIC
jgi:hypothetical protein